MKRKTFEAVPCSVARTMDVLGDWWVPLILRETVYGATRFSDFERMLPISRNILTDRLRTMVDHGLLERQPYGPSGARVEYVLTEKGWDAIDVLGAMMAWANHWIFDDQPPIELRDRESGARVRPMVVDAETGAPFDARRVELVPGPGFPESPDVRAFRFGEADTDTASRDGARS